MKLCKAILTIIITLSVFKVNAQNSKALATAFGQSYEFENGHNLETAINTLNAVYNETSYEINLRLGWLNYLSGKHKEAISFYQKARALMPAATEPLWGIVSPYSKLESWVDVEKTYMSILKMDTKNSKANYSLGLIYYYRKDYINAKKYFDVCLNLSPFGYNNMLMSAWTNYYLGNKNEASVLFNKTLLYSPNDKSALEGLSLIK